MTVLLQDDSLAVAAEWLQVIQKIIDSLDSSGSSPNHGYPVSNDLYAVVTKAPIHQEPGVVFRNTSRMGEVPAMSGSPVPSFSSMKDTSPVTYIMDNTGPGSHTGTHV